MLGPTLILKATREHKLLFGGVQDEGCTFGFVEHSARDHSATIRQTLGSGSANPHSPSAANVMFESFESLNRALRFFLAETFLQRAVLTEAPFVFQVWMERNATSFPVERYDTSEESDTHTSGGPV